MKSLKLLFAFSFFSLSLSAQNNQSFPFRNEKLEVEQRIFDLVSRLTVDEKIAQLKYNSPAIERLGIPAYNWWSEGLHGVARFGRATVFP